MKEYTETELLELIKPRRADILDGAIQLTDESAKRAGAAFAAVPPDQRAALLQRFREETVQAVRSFIGNLIQEVVPDCKFNAISSLANNLAEAVFQETARRCVKELLEGMIGEEENEEQEKAPQISQERASQERAFQA